MPPPYTNPLKRVELDDVITNRGTGSELRRSRGGTASTEDHSLTKDPEFDRKIASCSASNGTNTRAAPISSERRLFDPEIDSPIFRPTKPNTAASTTRRVYDSRVHAFYSKTENASSDDHGAGAPHFSTQEYSTARQPPLSDRYNQSDFMSTYPDSDSLKEMEPELPLRPETRLISRDLLAIEVKGIYAGLVRVEAKCINGDEIQSAQAQETNSIHRPPSSNEQWRALIALHKTLLHENHDFFLASQYSSASPSLSRLAAKYSMPARMWKHGIHAFLEVLRHRLPDSLDQMLAFTYIAYCMMALLYETVPTFEDTWVKCLGDLARYRMDMEDDDIRDLEVWSGVARFWYRKAADKSPNVGRLHHHLAILARPSTLQQMRLYTRSLVCNVPFESARESKLTLFEPLLNSKESLYRKDFTMGDGLIKRAALPFPRRLLDDIQFLRGFLNRRYNSTAWLITMIELGSEAIPRQDASRQTHKSGSTRSDKSFKFKRGLSGFVNGFRKSAFPDTCAAENVVSAAYAKEMNLPVQEALRSFKLGNSTKIESIGT